MHHKNKKPAKPAFCRSSNKTITWLLQEQQEQLPEQERLPEREQLQEQERLPEREQLQEQQELQQRELQQQELQQQELLLPFGHKRSEPEPAERRAERNESFFILNETMC
ncbi:hypothetical protein A7976_00160 [Methylobacillus sp. MM3]|jgi:hypothetical protein|nr:hypothetical protein A7976_00160 [Methylobacillus sp. MM3]